MFDSNQGPLSFSKKSSGFFYVTWMSSDSKFLFIGNLGFLANSLLTHSIAVASGRDRTQKLVRT